MATPPISEFSMAFGVLRAVTALVSTCSRHMSRAARKLRGSHRRLFPRPLLSRRVSVIPFLGEKKRIAEGREGKIAEEEMKADEDDEVWRRGILMGEKCQPLDFSGVIYYDCDGRQLAEVPTPRSPMRSPLPSFLADEKARK